MSPRIDFSNVRELTPVPEGEYAATLTGTKLVPEAKESKQPYVEMTFTIADGEFAGRKLFRNYSLQPKALWSFKQTLVRLGTDPELLSGELELEDVAEIAADAIGQPCRLSVGFREYQGNMRNELKEVLSAF